MLYLAAALAGRRAVAFCGALRRDLLPLTITADAPAPAADSFDPLYNIDEFARHGAAAVICTDDGSYGFRGLVTQAMERYLDRYIVATRRQRDENNRAAEADPTVRIYTCGPEGMMKRVAEIAAVRGIECQVAVERAMACGMGTCQSCCIKVRKPDPSQPPLAGQDWCYRLACTDGPIFRAADLLW
jgi:dihydroorotate dehydrogenase electron transfer subunit